MSRYVPSVLFVLSVLFVPLYAREIPLTIEHAIDNATMTWGLMGRTELPENHGMLIHYSKPARITIWMFNVNLDLDVAFLTGWGTIQEIRTLKAYPEKMDPARPVNSINEMAHYPSTDPIVRFYRSKSITSLWPTVYVLEMNRDWFAKNRVKVGDRLIFDKESPNATFITK